MNSLMKQQNLFYQPSEKTNRLIEAAITLITDDIHKMSARLSKKITTYTSPEQIQLRARMKLAINCHNTRITALKKMKTNMSITHEEQNLLLTLFKHIKSQELTNLVNTYPVDTTTNFENHL